ncbi:DUF1289 domain-containing protein [Sinimarinibacterium sp. CAU 1509]|uniref:DUF1289 domain-containing protein n=1 Tax=Sinimarinibacterium sp. CAU 1509 TaxID=2562283 RepID=UPI0010ABBBF9|nr:DUF1289 domain-containing protein [Sinimarinibacterium sp. CAU 1509]
MRARTLPAATASASAEVESPCISVCALDDAGICSGCGRTIDEITQWSQAQAARRLEIRILAERRLRHITSSNQPDRA